MKALRSTSTNTVSMITQSEFREILEVSIAENVPNQAKSSETSQSRLAVLGESRCRGLSSPSACADYCLRRYTTDPV